MVIRHLQDYIQILAILVGGTGAVLATGRPSGRARVILAALIVALVWAVLGGLLPPDVWPLHEFESPTVNVAGYIPFHWIDAILSGAFGAGLYFFAELSTALFEGKSPWITTASLPSAAFVVGMFFMLAIALAAVFWIVLFLAAQSLTLRALPTIESPAARTAISIVIAVPAGIILGLLVRLLTQLGTSTRKLTAKQSRRLGVVLTILGILIGLASPLLDLYLF